MCSHIVSNTYNKVAHASRSCIMWWFCLQDDTLCFSVWSAEELAFTGMLQVFTKEPRLWERLCIFSFGTYFGSYSCVNLGLCRCADANFQHKKCASSYIKHMHKSIYWEVRMCCKLSKFSASVKERGPKHICRCLCPRVDIDIPTTLWDIDIPTTLWDIDIPTILCVKAPGNLAPPKLDLSWWACYDLEHNT